MTATPDSIYTELALMGPPADPARFWGSKRKHVARVVVSYLFARWHAAGVRSVDVDAQGVPRPVIGTREHDGQAVEGLVSPSGKQLFVCARCGHTAPLPRGGECKGGSLWGVEVEEAVVAFLLAGGRFEADAAGLLAPVRPGC